MILPALRGVRWRFRPVRWRMGLRPSISLPAPAHVVAPSRRGNHDASNPSPTNRAARALRCRDAQICSSIGDVVAPPLDPTLARPGKRRGQVDRTLLEAASAALDARRQVELRVAEIGSVASLMRRVGSSEPPPDALEDLAGSMRATFDLAGTTGTPACAGRSRGTQSAGTSVAAHGRFRRTARRWTRTPCACSRRKPRRFDFVAGGRTVLWRGPFDARVRGRISETSLELASQFRLPVTLSRIGPAGRHHLRHALEPRAEGKACSRSRPADLVIDQVAVGAVNGRPEHWRWRAAD